MTELKVRRRGAATAYVVDADNPLPVSVEVPAQTDSGDFETLTVSTTALPITGTKLRKHTKALITVETASVRFLVHGPVPTASVGHQLNPGDTLKLDGRSELVNFRVIRKDGTNASLPVSLRD